MIYEEKHDSGLPTGLEVLLVNEYNNDQVNLRDVVSIGDEPQRRVQLVLQGEDLFGPRGGGRMPALPVEIMVGPVSHDDEDDGRIFESLGAAQAMCMDNEIDVDCLSRYNNYVVLRLFWDISRYVDIVREWNYHMGMFLFFAYPNGQAFDAMGATVLTGRELNDMLVHPDMQENLASFGLEEDHYFSAYWKEILRMFLHTDWHIDGQLLDWPVQRSDPCNEVTGRLRPSEQAELEQALARISVRQ